MSLFRIKEFWSNQCSNNEEYDQSSLKVSRINGDSDLVLIGSHSGFLRIYKPTGTAFGENAFYRPNDLFLETDLRDPILQIDVGKLVSGSQSKQIAILFPRSIGIYSLLSKDGIAEHGTQNALNLVYEHKLKRCAANFTIGPFGGVQNRDFLCIQSLDGMLTFYEQETFNFCCFLSEFLLPSPMVYVKSIDIFVTVSSDWVLKSYKYKSLSDCAHNPNEEKPAHSLDCLWQYNIGENVLDIQTLYDDISRQSHIAVLGEKNLYCFNDYRLRFMKKMDFLPQCFLFYYLDDGKCMFLVVSETSTLLLYQGTTLKWSAKLDFVPVAIGRAFFTEINGALVMLSEDGYMQFAYLGTEPNLFSAPPLKNQEIDFDKTEEELGRLSAIIKSNHTNDINLMNVNAERELVFSISVRPQVENLEKDASKGQPYCKVTIEIVPNAIFDEVHLSITVQKPLTVNPSSELYTNLIRTTLFTCFAYSADNYAIPSLELQATASFITSLGVPRVRTKKVTLPLRLVYETCPPTKDGQHKITLNISQNSVPLVELFPGENSLSSSTNAIGFKPFTENSPVVTILAAKSSKRYRFQSDDVSCLNLIVQEMVRRLKVHHENHTEFSISYNSPLPINECLRYVRNHFEKCQKVTSLQNELGLLSSQYRLIQKRLVAKFKQKNPTALGNLDILLQHTFEDVIYTTETLEAAKVNLNKCEIEVCCVLNLLQNLLNLMDNNDRDVESIQATFLSQVHYFENQNWEDVMDASLCFLLRTSLAKSEKDKLRAPHTSYEEVKDIVKLEKHFVQVLERISKRPTMETEEEEEEETATIPAEGFRKVEEEINDIGTEFATASTRVLSARQSLLKRRHKVDE